MEFLSSIQGTAATPVVLSMIYLLAIFWVRRPGRVLEKATDGE